MNLEPKEDYQILASGDLIQVGDVFSMPGTPGWYPAVNSVGDLVPPHHPSTPKYARRVTCTWKADDDGVLNTACNEAYCFEHEFTVGGAYKFCPNCGKQIRLCPPTSIPESEN